MYSQRPFFLVFYHSFFFTQYDGHHVAIFCLPPALMGPSVFGTNEVEVLHVYVQYGKGFGCH